MDGGFLVFALAAEDLAWNGNWKRSKVENVVQTQVEDPPHGQSRSRPPAPFLLRRTKIRIDSDRGGDGGVQYWRHTKSQTKRISRNLQTAMEHGMMRSYLRSS